MTKRRIAVMVFVLAAPAACGGRQLFDRPPPAPVTIAPLPAPSGPYGVGSLLLDVDDPRPTDPLTDGLPRVVEAQLWYPTAADAEGERMPYLPRASAIERLRQSSWFADRPAELARWTTLSAHALRDAVPAVRTGGFPVVLFAPDEGSTVQEYATLLQQLASRGLIVIAVEPRVARAGAIRRTSLRAGSAPSLAAEDLLLVLRQFVAASGTVAPIARGADLTRAGALAHGTGGHALLELCARETVIRRCAAVDAHPADDSSTPVRPLLALRSGTALDDDEVEALVRARWLTLFSHARVETRLLRLDGSGYLSATDAPWLQPDRAEAAGAGDAPERTIEVVATLLASFFGGDGEPFAALDATLALYPELLLES